MSQNDTPDDVRLYDRFYCTSCYEVVEIGHRSEVHDGDHSVDIDPIVGKEDGQWIAQSDNMGHYSPHMWIDVDDHDMCGDCGAVKIKPEEVEQYLSNREQGS